MYGTLPSNGQTAGIVAGGVALAAVLVGLGIRQGAEPLLQGVRASPAAIAAAPQCRIVAERANVRAGPSADAAVAWQVDRGLVLPCAPEHGGWRRVESADGTPGYVHARLLEPLQAE
jgi:SH3-like domain-containing protein